MYVILSCYDDDNDNDVDVNDNDDDDDDDDDDDTLACYDDDDGDGADESGGEEEDLVDTEEVGEAVVQGMDLAPLLDHGDDVGQSEGGVCRTPQTPPGSTSRSHRPCSTGNTTHSVPKGIRN